MECQDKRIVVSPEIFWSRIEVIKKLIEPLAFDKTLFVGGEPGFVLAARDRSSKPGARYDDMRFRTKVKNLLAMYYEKWSQDFRGTEEFLYLDKAYLHFYIIEPRSAEEKEFLLLHCDPNEPKDAAHAKYKQSLHLHIECSESSCYPHCYIWPHAHIALNTGYLDHVLKDVDSLTKAIEEAVCMLKDEVLEPFSNL
ncbi:hypothetical protein H6F95_19465 [Cyanobacteria bacterium FACHB-471]|nr:hypothetical protein [Cyanobacteria bacterium FACHB-471]